MRFQIIALKLCRVSGLIEFRPVFQGGTNRKHLACALEAVKTFQVVCAAGVFCLAAGKVARQLSRLPSLPVADQ
jgi:hypothetical protein